MPFFNIHTLNHYSSKCFAKICIFWLLILENVIYPKIEMCSMVELAERKNAERLMLNSFLLMLPISGVLLETGSISDTMVAKIVMVSIIATPEKSSVTSFRRILFQR